MEGSGSEQIIKDPGGPKTYGSYGSGSKTLVGGYGYRSERDDIQNSCLNSLVPLLQWIQGSIGAMKTFMNKFIKVLVLNYGSGSVFKIKEI
jgi:hypothetical protein